MTHISLQHIHPITTEALINTNLNKIATATQELRSIDWLINPLRSNIPNEQSNHSFFVLQLSLLLRLDIRTYSIFYENSF